MVGGIQPLDLEDVADEVPLVLEPAVEFGAVDAAEPGRETEVLHDPAGEDRGLGGAQQKAGAAGDVRPRRRLDPGIGRGLEDAPGGIALAVERDARLDRGPAVQEPGETLPDRRADHPAQVLLGIRRRAERVQGVAERAEDAGGGIHQRAVEIEEQAGPGADGHGGA